MEFNGSKLQDNKFRDMEYPDAAFNDFKMMSKVYGKLLYRII